VGCTASDRAEIRKDSREATEGTRARTADSAREASAKRREYQESMQARLDKIDRDIDEERAKAKTRRMTAKQRREYNERISELEQEKKDVRVKWSQMKDATDDNWEKFKDGMDEAVTKVENGWHKFVAELKD